MSGWNEKDAIALVDCNNFFVSCERAVNSKLEERPVVVLSNNDGCIISRSNEVKALGVSMGVPFFQVRELLEKHNTAVISCNHALYREFSDKIQNILADDLGTDAVELYSIDEAFLDVGTPDKLNLLGTHLRERILKEAKVPVSVGFAETKTLAKVANHLAKKSKKTNGVLDLYNSPYTDIALKRTEVGDIWGIGHRSAVRLKEMGIHTGFELKCTDPEQIKNHLNVFGARTVMELKGIKCLPLEISVKDSRSIAHTRTFGHTISNFHEIKDAVFYFTTRALEKMRWNGLMAKTITVYIQTDRFNPVPSYYSNACSYYSVYHSDITSEIYKWVAVCLQKIFRPNMQYKRAGVILSDLASFNAIPTRLFEHENFDKWHKLNRSIDELNFRYGRDVIKLAALNDKGVWQGQSTFRGNDEHHSVERERQGLGKAFSKPLRFL